MTVLGAAAAAWSSARSASTALAAGAERQFVETVTNQITANAAGLTYPPTQATLDQLASVVGGDTVVTYQGLRSGTGPDTGLITDAVRAAVQNSGGSLFAQRIAVRGKPWLIVGTPVMITSVAGTRTPSGIQVYAVRDLTGVQNQINGLTRSAAVTTALALPPAGIAPGPTLYFVDDHDHLQPLLRQTGQLGTVTDALSLLLSGATGDLRTDIHDNGTTQVVVTSLPGVLQLTVPLTVEDVPGSGIEQIVCTALGVEVQGGGPRSTKVQILFTQPTPESDVLRTCPLISPTG